MAKAVPVPSSYQKKMIPLMREQHNRGVIPTKDIDYLNIYFELTQDKELQDSDQYIVKRDGCSQYITSVGPAPRGMFYNQDFKKLYYVVLDTLYIWDVAGNTLSASIPTFFTTTTGDVGFTDYLYDDGNQVIVISDGTSLKQVDSSNTVTASTSPDLPVPHQPYPIFLDGYIFILKSNTSDLYNSNLNDPLAWTAGDFISAEIQPDQAIRPIKLNNYIVIFSSKSIEYFWDAGNVSGSPLQRNDTPVKFNGYLGGYAQWGNQAYIVGNNVEGQPDIFVLEDLKADSIGNETISRYLANLTETYTSYSGSMVASGGHTFYVLNAGDYTFVCDLVTKQWFRWGYQQQIGFPIGASVNTKTLTTYKSLFYLSDSSTIYEFSPTLYQDNGVNFTTQGVTDNEVFGTYDQKMMARLTVWADKPPASGVLLLSWSDDDYQSYSTPQPVELFQELPCIRRLGRFRRRAFKWQYTTNQPLRLQGFEVELNMGIN